MTDQTTTDDGWHLTKTISPRGFAFLPGIPSEYGGHVSVSESSAADGPHVWVRAVAPIDLNNPSGPTHEVPMHLTAENARRLAEQIQLTVREHYQNEPPETTPGSLPRAWEAFDPDTRRRVGQWFHQAAQVHEADGNEGTARHATWAAAVFGAYEATEDDHSEADG